MGEGMGVVGCGLGMWRFEGGVEMGWRVGVEYWR